MTENEKLKEICDKIEYDIPVAGSHFGGYTKEENEKCYWWFYYNKTKNEFHRAKCGGESFEINVREVIFTSEFIRYIYLYLHNNGLLKEGESFSESLMENLDDPVEFLYNLTIKEGKL